MQDETGGYNGAERRASQRSGDFSGDDRFDPNSLFQVVASAENAEQAASAMSQFVDRGDEEALRQAIAIYTRSARARGRTIEQVLAELNALSARRHERYDHGGKLLEPSRLKQLVLQTVLDGFGKK
jgi:hypothetical protein